MRYSFKKTENFLQKHIRITKQSGTGELVCTHWHSYYEWVEIMDGTADMMVGKKSFSVKSGDIVFIDSGMLHRLTATDECSIRGVVVPVLGRDAFVLPDIFHSPEDNPVIHNDRYLHTIIDLMTEEYELPDYDYKDEAIYAYTNLLNIITGRALQSTEMVKRKENPVLRRAVIYMHENFNRDISVNDVADSVNLSKYYFLHLFKESMGQTPMNYLKKIRLNNAVEMIEKSEYSITDIASKCGFSSVNYFDRVFKEYTNTTPFQYKKLIQFT